MRKQDNAEPPGELDTNRRKFLNTAAFAGLAGSEVGLVAGREDEVGARRGEPVGDGGTDAARAPGHQGGPPVEAEARRLRRLRHGR